MPIKGINEDIFSNSQKKREALKLKAKGQSVTFRIVKDNYYFEGLHFSKGDDGKFKVSHCPRVETDEYCEECQLFFDAKKNNDEQGIREHKVTINVYYMILDRQDSTVKLLQVTSGTKKKIDQYLITWKQAGKTARDFDLKLTRTENPGADYYQLTQIDSSLSPKLTEAEAEAIVDAEDIDLASFMQGDSIDDLPDFTI